MLAIEPMVNAGGPLVRMGDDGWAVYSEDGSLAAHFEFTIAVTADGPRILTPWHEDERLRPARTGGTGRLSWLCGRGAATDPEEGHCFATAFCLSRSSPFSPCLAVPACAEAAVQPYGTNDAGGFRNVLPPGENGLDTFGDVVAFKATGLTAGPLRRPAAALRKPRLRRRRR